MVFRHLQVQNFLILNWPKILQKTFEIIKGESDRYQNTMKLDKIMFYLFCKMALNGPKWPKMASNGPKWPKMVQNGPKWPKMAQDGQGNKWGKVPKQNCGDFLP
jgi:hypothetical protein